MINALQGLLWRNIINKKLGSVDKIGIVHCIVVLYGFPAANTGGVTRRPKYGLLAGDAFAVGNVIKLAC